MALVYAPVVSVQNYLADRNAEKCEITETMLNLAEQGLEQGNHQRDLKRSIATLRRTLEENNCPVRVL